MLKMCVLYDEALRVCARLLIWMLGLCFLMSSTACDASLYKQSVFSSQVFLVDVMTRNK